MDGDEIIVISFIKQTLVVTLLCGGCSTQSTEPVLVFGTYESPSTITTTTIAKKASNDHSGEEYFDGSLELVADHSYENWSRVIASGALFNGKFINTNFSFAYLPFAEAGLSNFSGADFGGAILSGSRFLGCRFQNAKLESMEAYGVIFHSSDFSGARLNGANLEDSDLTNVKFDGADLSFANLKGATGFDKSSKAVFYNTIMPDGSTRTD